MSASGPRYHIPFPSNFLSLNTRTHKTTLSNGTTITSPNVEAAAAHSFLSNRPTTIPRHASVSSVTSTDSVGSAPSTSPTQAPASPVFEQKVPAFLALNSKYAAPPSSVKEMSGGKSGFLSNRH